MFMFLLLTVLIGILEKVPSKERLLGETHRDHQWDAGRPGGLAGGGFSGVHAEFRNSVPRCQLCGPFSVLHNKRETEQAAAGWNSLIADCCVRKPPSNS